MHAGRSRNLAAAAAAAMLLLLGIFRPISGARAAEAPAADIPSLLGTIRHQVTRTTTITENGDLNPYAVVVAPVTIGSLHGGDVLADNFNDRANLQGKGTTIIRYDPATKQTSLFARLPQDLARCPGGVGLTTAMAVLKSGWVVVGSTPSRDGTAKTKGAGCLLVLDAAGRLAEVWTGPNIDGPWGNIAVRDHGANATLFVSMAGFDIPGPHAEDAAGHPATVEKAKVLRLDLAIDAGKPPRIVRETVVADGFGERADPSVFLIGPTGLALGQDDTLYVSDAVGNRIVAIAGATTRGDSAGTGRLVTKDGMLKRPLALFMAGNGHLLVANALNGQVVEIDAAAGRQLAARWVDTDEAQSPPGSGDLFGLAPIPDGKGFYFVEDDVNALVEAMP